VSSRRSRADRGQRAGAAVPDELDSGTFADIVGSVPLTPLSEGVAATIAHFRRSSGGANPAGASVARGRRRPPPGPPPPRASRSMRRRVSSSRARRAPHRTPQLSQIAQRHQAVDEARGEAVAPPTRSRISSPGRGVASTKPASRDHAIALQSLIVALRTARSVVAMTWKFGNSTEARSIIERNDAVSSPLRLSSLPSTSRPRQAVKSSSLPIITSM